MSQFRKVNLCSYGLYSMVSQEDIQKVLAQIQNGELGLHESCKELVDPVNTNGGEDKITVILLSI